MLTALLAAALSCPTPVIENRVQTWTENDQWNYETAIKRCPTKFPEAPCLKLFIKKEDYLYEAICGEKLNELV